jgi:N6-adenosine-specific RNA methylase IME4
MRYGVILADPPWHFRVRSPKGEGRSASQHYDVMSLADIKALPVADQAADDCALFLWAVDPMLPQALDVIEAWGFTYKTVGFTWAKQTRDQIAFTTGMGYYTRANPEQCLLATRGRPKRLHMDVRQLVIAPRREHSRKPDRIRTDIERLFAGPYLEMLHAHARQAGTPGAIKPICSTLIAAAISTKESPHERGANTNAMARTRFARAGLSARRSDQHFDSGNHRRPHWTRQDDGGARRGLRDR